MVPLVCMQTKCHAVQKYRAEGYLPAGALTYEALRCLLPSLPNQNILGRYDADIYATRTNRGEFRKDDSELRRRPLRPRLPGHPLSDSARTLA